MKYLATMILLIVFSTPLVFASGGPTFDQLHSDVQKGKKVIKLIDPSSKEQSKPKICSRNQGTTIKHVPC